MAGESYHPDLELSGPAVAESALADPSPAHPAVKVGSQTSQPLDMLINALHSSLHTPASIDSPEYYLKNLKSSAAKAIPDISTGTERTSLSKVPLAILSASSTAPAQKFDGGNAIGATNGCAASPNIQADIEGLSFGDISPAAVRAFAAGQAHPQPTPPAHSQQSALNNLESLAQLQAIARQSAIPQYQVPSLASLLTPADTALLASLLALQQRQHAQQLSNGDLLLCSPRQGHGRSHSSAPSSLYKTELCRSWQETGSCRYGNKCQFAHGPNELRPIQRHPKYKTEICRTFAQTGTCPYGSRCRFIHYFHRPALNTTAALLSQAYQGCAAPRVGGSGSLEAYLAALGIGGAATPDGSVPRPAAGAMGGQVQPAVHGQVLNGTFMPPLPQPLHGDLPALSGLPSLTQQSYSTPSPPQSNGSRLVHGQPDPGSEPTHRRLPVFRTFTDAARASTSASMPGGS